ncbi:MAG: family 78 glycoside hydrolase catalytic domain [Chitinophaga sp.]|uniref:alpha-L-rhamnosidase n=1 Tax=Chitinophaga sp. TaxID=1869181 RepID=UPI001B0DA4CA|nr:alpha-L-rhamnosidase [Chitinophaga sp.]MBO9731502.1 family 78 glycoside hydrolase catalytic domain [Chitinophaga sp.]
MLRYILAVVCLLFVNHVNATGKDSTRVVQLKCEYQKDPLGITNANPYLSWELVSAARGVLQTAWQVLVSDDPDLLQKNTGNIWDSRRQPGEQSIQVPFSGQPLLPAKTYYWKVRVWDNKGQTSAWSEPATWKMGLRDSPDWHHAAWIAFEELAGDNQQQRTANAKSRNILPLLRKAFSVQKPLKQATMYISGLGQFELSLNGHKVGDHFLDPGWTQYNKEALYVTFDLTKQINPGSNVLGVMLGNGFYHIPKERYRKLEGAFGYPKLICRLLLEYEDGSHENIVSDSSWKTAPGPVVYSSIYGGEDYNAGLEQAGWDQQLFNDSSWKAAIVVKGPANLQSQQADPLKVMDTLKPVKVYQPRPGVWVYDLGQNASGIPAIAVTGSKGSTVKITPGELVAEDGSVTQQASGGPCLYQYTLKGEGAEQWHPLFSYYGFRYLQVEGAVPAGESNPSHLPEVQAIAGWHTRNAAATAGNFSCSYDLFNRIFRLINWAVKSNMASVFTDCPHREKLGWLEEAHLMGNAISYNFDIARLLRKITTDMREAQLPNGMVPDIAPEYVEFVGGFRDAPEFGSAAVIVPWNAWRWYNDKQMLRDNYHMMQRYVGYLASKSVNDTICFGLGDWFDIGPNGVGESQNTPKGNTATAFYYYDLSILAKTAAVLGYNDDVRRYEAQMARVKVAFNKFFYDKTTKQYISGSQAANALPVYIGLVPSPDKAAVVNHIVTDIQQHNNSITVGEISHSFLLRVLQAAGKSDLIYQVNARTDVPGYGYQLEHGATALTESWQAYRNVSNNHLMLGHLMEWFYNTIAGIDQAESSNAFKQLIIHPRPVGGITFAKASYQSLYGVIRSEWKQQDGVFELTTEIPGNTTATVYLPAASAGSVFVDGKPVKQVKDVHFVRKEGTEVVYSVGSGVYHFRVTVN